MPLLWDLPGGSVESGETPEETLLREVSEETCLHIKIRSIIHVFTNIEIDRRRQTFQFIYACNYIHGDVVLSPDDHDQMIWAEKGDLKGLEMIPFLSDFVKSRSFMEL
jgi:8-oxo-dGTP diphosphatase